MDLCEYLCIWAGLLICKVVELVIMTWVGTRLVLPVLFVMLLELAVCGSTTTQDFAFKFLCYYEKINDDLNELLHWFDRQPKLGVRTPNGWELVAATRSSNSGYQVQHFYPVVICDHGDDPFGPDHVSSVYNVEVRERNEVCYTVIVWQVSLLNGGQKEVHRYDVEDSPPDSSGDWPSVQCFESSGIIFVHLRLEIFVYDVRYKKWQVFNFPEFGRTIPFEGWLRFPLASMSCLQRIWCDEDGKKVMSGWRIRTIGAESSQMFPDTQLRMSLTNAVFEIRTCGEVREISSESIVLSRYHWGDRIRPVRTSTAFGIFFEIGQTFDGPSVLFDESTSSYVYCASADKLIALEVPFGYYFNVSSPNEELSRGLCPVFLNSSECIECSRDGTVFRYEFAPSTLKYRMAKALFRAKPDLRIQMSADSFRRDTGIGGMEAHFRSCDD